MNALVVNPPGTQARLPGAIVPVLVEATRSYLAHTGPDGRIRIHPGKHLKRDWYGLGAPALLYARELTGNPFRGDPRLRALLERAGRTLVADFADPRKTSLEGLWFEGSRPHEWILEAWLQAYELLTEAGEKDLVAEWIPTFLRCGEVYSRYCSQAAGLRRMTSPNLKISTNHFAFFAAILVRIGKLFGVQEHVDLGLDVARRIAAHQHPDGYWAETHGPTTSYNFVTLDALALVEEFTGQDVFDAQVRRALGFHIDWTWPDATCVETIDQRVRWRREAHLNAIYAFSRWPEGRWLAEWYFANGGLDAGGALEGGAVSSLVTAFLYYRSGPISPPPAARAEHVAKLSDLPAGLAKLDPWVAALSGIPSRPRPHANTLDRQNLLGVWHRDCGLIVGGGNNRNSPRTATFWARVMRDPHSPAGDGVEADDAYVPVAAECRMGRDGGTLDLEYWGFDASLEVRFADATTCRVTAAASALPKDTEVLFNPNFMVAPGEPVVTGAGEKLDTSSDARPWERSGKELGGSFGQGRWRAQVPAEAVLRFPMTPYAPEGSLKKPEPVAVLSVPVGNRSIVLTLKIS